jgi:glycosyltransferase involved in cell wall biosynthesis
LQAATSPPTAIDAPSMQLSVIVPARNEEDCLGACLQSLASQSDGVFPLGVEWEILAIDDHSTDRTLEIARSISGVTVLKAPALPKG